MQCDENPVGYFQSVLPPVREARSGPSPRSRCFCTIWGRPRCWARVAGRSNPALATRRRPSKAMRMRSGGLHSSIYSVLLAWSRVLSFQNHYPRSTVAPSCRFNPPRHASFRWIGAKYQVPIDKHRRQNWSCSCSIARDAACLVTALGGFYRAYAPCRRCGDWVRSWPFSAGFQGDFGEVKMRDK